MTRTAFSMLDQGRFPKTRMITERWTTCLWKGKRIFQVHDYIHRVHDLVYLEGHRINIFLFLLGRRHISLSVSSDKQGPVGLSIIDIDSLRDYKNVDNTRWRWWIARAFATTTRVHVGKTSIRPNAAIGVARLKKSTYVMYEILFFPSLEQNPRSGMPI